FRGREYHVHQELRPVLWPVQDRCPPEELDLTALEEPGHDAPDLGEIELGAGRARGPEGDAGELQPRGSLFGTCRDQPKGVGAHGKVSFVLENLQAVDHGTHGAHKVMTDARDEKSGEFEIVHGEAFEVQHGVWRLMVSSL